MPKYLQWTIGIICAWVGLVATAAIPWMLIMSGKVGSLQTQFSTLKESVTKLEQQIANLATKESVTREIRVLWKELLENDKHLLRWVLASHGDKAIKQAIRDQLTDVESKIQNLDRALTNNLPEIPDLFKAAVGKIDGFEPASGLLTIRTLENNLVRGKVQSGEVIGDVPVTKELIGKDVDVIFKGSKVFALRIYETIE